ncbi:deoxynucleotide monophosphate kinase [Chromobacterium haemolyticum]|uniref:deoxynucleotide monophosphate kinase n=1 Tax=Chromobacterium haemolyticum TaxID=394935 RepID=UPI0009DB5244|nr:deoxynucleotide monophosphate kinase [Chromobacterium haemolyticum]OQS39777.1 deoxynucleotide monophosphate kinase [Chromobacterium haemolyticum]
MSELPNVLALCGAAGAGKSTIAAELAAQHGYTVVKFAGPLKAMMRALGLTDDEIEGHLKEQPSELLGGATPRHAMQTLGTEWGRQLIHAELWVGAWARTVLCVLAAGGRVVVDDCRFANELDAVQRLGGVAVRLQRAGAGLAGAHSSENALDSVELPTVANDAAPGEVAAALAALIARRT